MIYELILSKGQTVKIDEEDLTKIKNNLSENLIMVKQAIINPSFLVMIVPTNEPDVVIKPKYEIEDGMAKLVSETEVKVLSDLMSSDVKRLN